MAVISVRIPDNVYKYAEQFAKFEGVTLSNYIRHLISEQIEDFEDTKMVRQLEEDMIEHPEDYQEDKLLTHDEVWSEN